MATKNYLVFDMGASNCRVVIGRFDGEHLTTQVTHRFDNRPVRATGTLYWDNLQLFLELKIGMQKSFALFPDIASVGVDAWGVDFGLVDGNGRLIANPVHYRDERRHTVSRELLELVPAYEMFKLVGTSITSYKSIFQLYAMKQEGSCEFTNAQRFLMIADLLGYLLTGEAVNEHTGATGSAAHSLSSLQ